MGYINGFQFADMKQQNRFYLQILAPLDGSSGVDLFDNKSWLVRATDLPNVEHNPVVVDTINSEYKIKGKSRWQDISVTFYDPIGTSERVSGVSYDGSEVIHNWTVFHHDSVNDIDGYMRNYKRTMNLVYLTPDGEATNRYWSLRGAFFANTNWGSVDVSSDDLVLIEATISYDFAVLEKDPRSPEVGGDDVPFDS